MSNKKYWAVGLLIGLFITYFEFWEIIFEIFFRFLGIMIILGTMIEQFEKEFGKFSIILNLVFTFLAFIIAIMSSDLSSELSKPHQTSTTKSYSSSQSPLEINTYGIKPANNVTTNNDNINTSNPASILKSSTTYEKSFDNNNSRNELPKVDIPEAQPSSPNYNISPNSNIELDDWEYIAEDEYGNKYYISKYSTMEYENFHGEKELHTQYKKNI